MNPQQNQNNKALFFLVQLLCWFGQKGGVKSETVPLDTVNTAELGAHQKSHTLQPVSPVRPELVTLLKDFLAAQQRRMEGLAEEIRLLKNSILALPLFTAEVTRQSRQSPSVSPQERPRRQVLTPGPRQQYRTASSTSTAHTTLAERALNRTASTAQHVRRGESETPSYQQGDDDIETYLLQFGRVKTRRMATFV